MREFNRPRGFEDRLLHELKNVVSERNQTMNSTEENPVKTPRFGRVAKFSLTGAVGAVALGVGAIVALPMLTASPAYAVETTEDGNIRIEIHGPEDAAGLEETLAEHGVQAEAAFTPAGEVCSDDWYTPGQTDSDTGISQEAGTDDEGRPFLTLEVDPDDYPTDGDRTLMIEVTDAFFDSGTGKTKTGDDEIMLVTFAVGTAVGDIGECDPRPVEQPVEGGPEDEGDDEKGTNDKKDDDGSKSKTED